MPADVYSLGIGVHVDREAVATAIDGLKSSLGDQSASLDKLAESMGAGNEIIEKLGQAEGLENLAEKSTTTRKTVDALGTALRAGGTAWDVTTQSILAADRAAGRAIGSLKAAGQVVAKNLGQGLSAANAGVGALGVGIAGLGGAVMNVFSRGANAATQFAAAARTGFEFMKGAEDLGDATQRMAVQFGEGRALAEELGSEILRLGIATGTSLEDTTKLAVGMSMAGVKLGEFSAGTQASMARLSAVFGVSGEDIAKTTRGLDFMGGSLDTLLGDATAFTKTFGIPGMMQELPAIVGNAQKIMLKFGGAITTSGNKLAQNTMNLGGVIAKTYGVTMAEAIGTAAESMQKFASQANQDRGVFLGLDDDFSGLTKTLMENGVGLFNSIELVKELGGKDPLNAVKALSDRLNSMPDGFMKDRFEEQLRREMPEHLFGLVKDVGALNAALADREAQEKFAESIGGKGVESFNKLGESMLESTKGLRAIFNNLITLGKAVVGSAIGPILTDMFAAANARFTEWAKRLQEFTERGDFKAWVERVRPVLVRVGEALLSIGTVVGPVGAALGGLFGAVTTGVGGFKILNKVLGLIGTVIPGVSTGASGLGGIFGVVGKTIGKIVGKAGPIGLAYAAFEGVKTAVMDMGAVLGNPQATGLEKLEALFRGGLKGIASAVNTVLLGIPGWLMSKFFPDMERSFDVGIAGLFDRIKAWAGGGGIGNVLSAIGTTVGGWIKNLGILVLDYAPDMTGFAASLGQNLGAAIGGIQAMVLSALGSIASGIWGALKSLFSDGITQASSAMADTGQFTVMDSLMVIFKTIGDSILAFVGGVMNGFLGAFGTNLDIAAGYVLLFWAQTKATFMGGVDSLYDMFVGFFLMTIPTNINNAIGFFEKFWVTIKATASATWALMAGAFDIAISTMKAAGFSLAAVLTNTFGDMATAAIDKIKPLVEALAPYSDTAAAILGKLDSAQSAIKSVGAGFQMLADEEAGNASKSAEATRARLAAIEQEKKAQFREIDAVTNGLNNQFAMDQAAREAKSAANAKARDAEVDAIADVIAAEKVGLEQKQKIAMASERFNREAQSGIETTLASFGESAAGLEGINAKGLDAGKAKLREYMDASIASISEAVSKGEINSAQAAERLREASSAGMEEARRAALEASTPMTPEAAPASVAAAAAGPGGGGGGAGGGAASLASLPADLAAFNAAIADFKESVGKTQKIKLQGGDRVTQALAREAAISNAGTNASD